MVTKGDKDIAFLKDMGGIQNIPKDLVALLSNPEMLQTFQNLIQKAIGQTGKIPEPVLKTQVSSSSLKPLPQKEVSKKKKDFHSLSRTSPNPF